MKAATNFPVPLPQRSMFLCLIVFIVKIALIEKGHYPGTTSHLSCRYNSVHIHDYAMLTVDVETGKYVYFINY